MLMGFSSEGYLKICHRMLRLLQRTRGIVHRIIVRCNKKMRLSEKKFWQRPERRYPTALSLGYAALIVIFIAFISVKCRRIGRPTGFWIKIVHRGR